MNDFMDATKLEMALEKMEKLEAENKVLRELYEAVNHAVELGYFGGTGSTEAWIRSCLENIKK